MADKLLLENGTGLGTLEDGSGHLLLEQTSSGGITTYIISNNTGADYSGVEDLQIRGREPDNHQGNTELRVSVWESPLNDYRSTLIRFTGMASLPAGGTIVGARLKLYQINWADFGAGGTQSSIHVAPCLRPWVATQATWNSFSTGNAFAEGGGHTNVADYDAPNNINFGNSSSHSGDALTGTYVNFDLLSMIGALDEIYKGLRTNNGFILSRFPRQSLTEEQQFRQSEGTDGQRPILELDIEFGGGSPNNYPITALNGSYSITGRQVTISKNRNLVAQTGSYSYTGRTVDITYNGALQNYSITALTGTYGITGINANVSRSKLLISNTGNYTITGRSVNISKNRFLTSNTGLYSIVGRTATINKSKYLNAQRGTYDTLGFTANIIYFNGIVVDNGLRFDLTTGKLVKIINEKVVISF